jgi:transmembrane sensor
MPVTPMPGAGSSRSGSRSPLSAPAAATALDAAAVAAARALRSLGGALGIGAVSLLGLHGLQAQRGLQTQRTAAGRTGHWTLADGSQLWLNAGSEVTIDIGNGNAAPCICCAANCCCRPATTPHSPACP